MRRAASARLSLVEGDLFFHIDRKSSSLKGEPDVRPSFLVFVRLLKGNTPYGTSLELAGLPSKSDGTWRYA
jgi:hypothetical protein